MHPSVHTLAELRRGGQIPLFAAHMDFAFDSGLDNRKSVYIVCIPFVVSGSFLQLPKLDSAAEMGRSTASLARIKGLDTQCYFAPSLLVWTLYLHCNVMSGHSRMELLWLTFSIPLLGLGARLARKLILKDNLSSKKLVRSPRKRADLLLEALVRNFLIKHAHMLWPCHIQDFMGNNLHKKL